MNCATILISLVIIVSANAVLLADPPPHPRLFFTRDDLPRIRKSGFEAESLLDEKEMTLTYFGGKRIAFPLPPEQPGKIEEPPGFDFKKFGHYPYWTSLSKQYQTRMCSLSLAYGSTGREDYARRAIEYALALSKWSVWTDLDYSKHTCLDTCHITMGVAAVYDICYDRMTEEERRQVREAMVKLGLEPLMADIGERAEHNLQMLRASALGIGGIAVLGEAPAAEDYVAAARDYYKWFLDGRFTSSNTEGMGYTSYGMENCMVFADVLNRAACDDSLLRHPAVEMIVRMAIYFQCPRATGLVNFSDCGIANYFPVTMKVLNNALGNGYAGWYLQKSRMADDGGWGGAIYGNPKRVVTPPRDWPTSAAFQNIGWVALRSGWGDDDTLLAFQCSDSRMGHNHRDQNNLVLNCAGEWLITDPGYKSFEGGAKSFYGVNTVGHNSILVDGDGQDKLGGGRVVSFFTSGPFDYTAGDASGSYDPSKLSRFVRRIAYVKPDYFVMLDEVASEGSPRQFEWLVRTDASGKYYLDGAEGVVGETKQGREIRISKERTEVVLLGLLPAKRTAQLRVFEGAENYGPYVSVSTAEKVSSAKFLTVIVPGLKDNPPAASFSPIEQEGVAGVTGQRGAFTDTVLFRTGSGIVRAADVRFLGECCLVRCEESGALRACALSNGRMLEQAGRKLIVTSRNAGIAVSHEMVSRADVSLGGAAEVRIHVPARPGKVLVDGKPAHFRYDCATEMMILDLPKGDHKLVAEPLR